MSDVAPEQKIWDVLRGGLATRALAIVAGLGIPQALAPGPRPVEHLAREAGADTDALHRILRALASEGIFAEEERGVFRNTPASELLLTSGWDDFAVLFGGVWYRSVERLDASRKATSTCWRRSSTTGTTNPGRRSSARSAPPRPDTRGSSSSTPSCRPGMSRSDRNGSTC